MPVSHPRRLLVGGLIGACVAGLASVPASAEQSSGEIVLPPYYSEDVARVTYLEGSTGGLVWQADGAKVRFRATGSSTTRTTADAVKPEKLSVTGGHLTYRHGDAVNYDLPDGDEYDPLGPVVDIDLATGARTVLSKDANGSLDFGLFRGGTGDGWLEDRGEEGLVGYRANGERRAYGRPPGAATYENGGYVRVLAADTAGAVTTWWGAVEGTPVLAYLDFGSGGWTVLAAVPAGSYGQAAMTGDVIAWYPSQSSVLSWVNRSDLGTRRTVALGAPIDDIAVAGTTLAVATTAGKGNTAVRQIRVGGLGKALTAVESSLQLRQSVVAYGNQVGVVAGRTVATYGVYPLAAGRSTLGAASVLFGPGLPTKLDGSIGRLEVGNVRAGGDPVVRTVTANADLTKLWIGEPRVLEGEAETGCDRKGVYELCREAYGRRTKVVVRQDGRLVLEVPLPVDGFVTTQLIERGLLVRWACEDYSGEHEGRPCSPDERVEASLYDLETGARTELPDLAFTYGDGAGDTVWHVGPGGEIFGRDLATGVDTLVRPAGVAAGNAGIDPRRVDVEFSGDWVHWMIKKDGGWTDRSGFAETAAVNARTGHRIDLTAIQNDRNASRLWFSSGVAAWMDMNDHDVHVIDLTSGAERVVGRTGPWRNATVLALTAEWVAWMVADGSVHVLPLGQIQAGTPRYDGTIDAPVFSTAAGAAPYTPQGDTNRPVNSWTMTIRGGASSSRSALAAAPVVRTLSGSAKTGTVRPRWDGKDANGKRVPDGMYTWTLRGTGPGGALQNERGTSSTITGSVRVDSRTPTPSLSAPSTGTTKGFTLTWSSGEKRVRYGVKVAVGTPDKKGVIRWAKAKTWLKEVSGTSQSYRNGSTTPVDLVKGRSYRFTVTATDRAGNTASTSRVVKVR